MSLKTTVFTNIQYKRVNQHDNLRKLLRYLQFRDGSVRRDHYLKATDEERDAGQGYAGIDESNNPAWRELKWVDRGMGSNYQQLLDRANDWAGHKVLARTWVISPTPDLMKWVPEEMKVSTLQRVTEETVERWHEQNGWTNCEYSYVLHDKEASTNEQMLHAHVITPGTVQMDELGVSGRADIMLKKAHMVDLNRTAEGVFREELEQLLGREMVQAIYDERDRHIVNQRFEAQETDKAQEETPRRSRMQRTNQTQTVMALLKEEKERKKRKKQQRRMSYFQLQAYSHHQWEKNRSKREAQWRDEQIQRYLDKAAARQAAQQADHQQTMESIRAEEKRRLDKIHEDRSARHILREKYGEKYVSKLDTIGLDRELVPEIKPRQPPERER